MNNTALNSLYNSTVRVNIMFDSLAYALFAGDEPLTPTNKHLKIPSGKVIKSHGVARNQITINQLKQQTNPPRTMSCTHVWHIFCFS